MAIDRPELRARGPQERVEDSHEQPIGDSAGLQVIPESAEVRLADRPNVLNRLEPGVDIIGGAGADLLDHEAV